MSNPSWRTNALDASEFKRGTSEVTVKRRQSQLSRKPGFSLNFDSISDMDPFCMHKSFSAANASKFYSCCMTSPCMLLVGALFYLIFHYSPSE